MPTSLESFLNAFARLLLPLAIAAGFAETVYGLLQMSWPRALPWEDTGVVVRFVLFVAACVGLVALIARFLRCNPLWAAAAVAALLATVTGVLPALAFVTGFFASSSLLGKRVADAFFNQGETSAVEHFLIGAGLYGTAMGLLAHFPCNYAGLYAGLLIAPWLLWCHQAADLLTAWRGQWREHPAVPAHLDWLKVGIGAVALLHFTVALLPELGHDALAMHLFIPSQLAWRHYWPFDVTTYIWAVMPALGDWIFAILYLLAGETASRLVNASFIFVLAWQINSLAKWAGASRAGASWAALLFLATPLTFTESSSLYIESVWTAFVVAGAAAVLRIGSSSVAEKSDLAKGGLFLGFALAAKAVTIAALPVLLLVMLVRYKSWLLQQRALFYGLGLMLIVGSPPYLTALHTTGNPLFPFYNEIFKSSFFSADNFRDTRWLAGLAWHLPYSLTFLSGRYMEAQPGAAGFQWCLLGAPACLLVFMERKLRALALIALGLLIFSVIFSLSSYLRYVFPAFVLLTAGAASALHVEARPFWLHWIMPCLLVATLALNLLFFNAGAHYGDFALKAALSEAGRDSYLRVRSPTRNVVAFVNQLNREHSPVLYYAESIATGLTADALYPNWYNYSFERKMQRVKTAGTLVKILRAEGVRFIVLDRSYGEPAMRAFIESVSEVLLETDPITVRVLRKEYLFQKELLQNPNFQQGGGWMSDQPAFDLAAGSVVVSDVVALAQTVAVSPGRAYLNSIKARCKDGPAQGRLQINWLDKNSEFLRVDAKAFDCKPEISTFQMEAYPPADAAFASVYATGHLGGPLVYTENSFRQ